MLFNSIAFTCFFPLVFIVYWFVCNKSIKWQNLLLLVAGYVFYGWWDWRFLGLLAFSTWLDYTTGLLVAGHTRRKMWLYISMFNNLAVLCIFKYFDFFSLSLSSLLNSAGFEAPTYLLNLALPVGISFYTFHGMSYVLDLYHRRIEPEKSWVDYAVFVCFFPLLVAGPIERASHLLPQIKLPRTFNYQQAIEGSRLILWGFFKKIVLADTIAPLVNQIWEKPNEFNYLFLLLAAIGFAFQIYGDFSGYSDIALGTAKLLGFELLSNFKFPYFSRNIPEFWRRWHISLSSWFRDYLYIPLGGSKNGKWQALRNTFIIFIISGFWHGANFTFIVWGLIHASMYIPWMLFGKNRQHVGSVVAENTTWPTIKEWVQMIATFLLVTLAWVFFRSESIAKAWLIIKNIFIAHSGELISPIGYYLPIGLGVLFMEWNWRKNERNPLTFSSSTIRKGLYLILFLSIVFVALFRKSSPQFIYFQF